MQQSAACAQTTNGHTYAILEQDQVEELSPSEDNTREVDMEHMYVILEQDQHLSHSSREQTEPECHILEEEGQPNSWMSASLQSQESKPERKHSRSRPRDTNFELVQIYNTVSPTPPKARAAEAAEQHSHQACSKKQSLPSYLGARPMEYSAMDVRNALDVKKKKRKKKKESEVPSNSEAAIAATSHKISTTSCPPLSLFTDTNTSRCSTMDAPVTDSYQQKKACTANQEHA